MTALPAVVDFDGTLADLAIDWETLAARLGAETISDEFQPRMWAPIREVELAHLATAPVNEPLVEELSLGVPFGILTNNCVATVEEFLEQRPALRERCVIVVGREDLFDSKQDAAAWAFGVTRCREALSLHEAEAWEYIGDSDYELEFARSAGAIVRDIRGWRAR